MTHVIQAIYAKGVFRPLKSLDLPENQQFQIIVESPSGGAGATEGGSEVADPLAGLQAATGISDLAENFDDYRLGIRKP
jgi:predicted DNA-binding antitoxin AbrB/MazE fold protein